MIADLNERKENNHSAGFVQRNCTYCDCMSARQGGHLSRRMPICIGMTGGYWRCIAIAYSRDFDTNKEHLLKVMPMHIGISPDTQAMQVMCCMVSNHVGHLS